jgi:hypothetical protein
MAAALYHCLINLARLIAGKFFWNTAYWEGPSFVASSGLTAVICRAISTLARLLQTPYRSYLYDVTPVTSALLRLDPLWDPLRSDPAFQKFCEEKQP